MKVNLLLILCLIGYVAAAQTNVLMQHNNIHRSGWNSHETMLTTGNVKTGSFGYLFYRVVDDQIYAQPLVMSKVNIPNVGIRNVVYVATVNNSVYAFDADLRSEGKAYWSVNLTPAGARPVNKSDVATACGGYYNDFSGNIGIVGTPVIDSISNTIYVVAKSYSTGAGYQQYLHALDISTGAERSNSPKLITAQVQGNGSGSNAGIILFDAFKQNQRSGLVLVNGIVYITWASHGDCDPYHGWILGYDQSTLEQKIIYNATPEGYKGGIWMAACGIAADSLGNLYVVVGNGSVGVGNDPTDLTNRSESTLKLTPSGSTLAVSSFFTPNDYPELEAADLDFGVTGILLIPGTNLAMAGAKDGRIYLMDRNNMGGYNGSGNQVIQTFNQNSSNAHNLTSLTFFHGYQNDFVYAWSDNVPLKAFPFNRTTGQMDLLGAKSSPLQGPVGYNGAFLSVSSNGSIDSTAILWTSYAASGNANQETRPGILRALSASDITKELWNSSQDPADNPGNYAKFNCPTIANGKVYLATFSNRLMVYGLTKGVVTGTRENFFEPTIYPNPARDAFKVSYDQGTSLAIKIVDVSGKVIYQSDALQQNDEVRVDHFVTGIYFVQIAVGQTLVVRKLVVQR